MAFSAMKGWTTQQKHVVAASYLGWTLDAFDYFLLVLVLTDIAKDSTRPFRRFSWATFFTLAMRPVGAYVFGRLADRYGRRPVMMIDVATYAALALRQRLRPT